MADLDPAAIDALLDAAEAALAERLGMIVHVVAPGLELELVVDGHGLVGASWRCGTGWAIAAIGEG